GATSQEQAFEDTWQWGHEAEQEYLGLIASTITKEKPGQKLIDLITSMREYLGECSLMAYLCMMAPRLLEMKRVLKETGSIYLHCDPTASHYLKLLMDSIFDVKNFRNEIIWCYSTSGRGKREFSKKHDIIFFYSKSKKYFWNDVEARIPYSPEYIKSHFKDLDENGRICRKRFDAEKWRTYYPDKGMIPNDWWEIPYVNSMAKERLGYPTQKPETLLERIIKTSSNKEDIILDPFCGCGTATAVAQRLNRKWIGIDITYFSINVIKERLKSSGIKEGVNFEIAGEPTDIYSAEKLAQTKPFQFEIWAVFQIEGGTPTKKTGDEGVDGIVNFIDFTKRSKAGKGIIQVKGTRAVAPGMVRDLKGTLKSQGADFSILITLKKPTRGMITEAVKEGYFEYRATPQSKAKKIPKIQLLTVEDLFKNPIPVLLPADILPAHKKAVIKESQAELF
ncbi:MAG: restriction endonuclease, partial [Candidatus Omnitrophica bacterium]|nr:restriction endonuclease [Candidatus Omnitrophota bacterium]